MVKYDYDVIIIGAGPAGSTTARYIRPEDNNLRVLLIDRRKEIGLPVQCGEGLFGISFLKKFIPEFDIPDYVKAHEIKWIDCISPYQTTYRTEISGWTINRDLFDQYLADKAISLGAELRLETSVKRLKDVHTIVTSKGTLTGKIIVGADGAISLTARSCGLETPKNLCFCVISIVKGDFYDNTVRIHLGKRFAGGFAWVFSKGNTANIGMGTEMKQKKPLRQKLNEFIKDLGISQEDILSRSGGIVPMGGPIPQTVSKNVMIVGDAAGMVFPSTGGGIALAMIAGRECGLTIADHFNKGVPLNSYEYRWRKLIGRPLANSLKIKKRLLWITRHDLLLEIGMRFIGKKWGLKKVKK